MMISSSGALSHRKSPPPKFDPIADHRRQPVSNDDIIDRADTLLQALECMRNERIRTNKAQAVPFMQHWHLVAIDMINSVKAEPWGPECSMAGFAWCELGRTLAYQSEADSVQCFEKAVSILCKCNDTELYDTDATFAACLLFYYATRTKNAQAATRAAKFCMSRYVVCRDHHSFDMFCDTFPEWLTLHRKHRLAARYHAAFKAGDYAGPDGARQWIFDNWPSIHAEVLR